MLLLDGIDGGRPYGLLLQGQVHAFVASDLLGVARFDELDGDTEAEPPDSKARVPSSSFWGER